MNKVLFDNEVFDILKKGVDTLCNAVKVTLGPNGKNVLIFNKIIYKRIEWGLQNGSAVKVQ